MNGRKKLIELLEHDDCPIFMVFGDNMEGLADYLIANGVTVQQEVRDCHWATERAYKNGYEAGKRDAVEVVRCKDCRRSGVYTSGKLYCKHQDGLTDPKPDDFCSYGERRK